LHVLKWLGSIFIVGFGLYELLESFGIDVAPLLAGAGIVGLAFGFGGQYLIRDLINGIFILLEGQFRVNDVVKIGELGGLVESMNLRATQLRDLEGRVIYIPNGEIKTVINFTKGYSQALLDIGVAYKENVDEVMKVMKEVAKGMRQDPYFSKLILDDMEMLGVDAFMDSAVVIKCRMKTLPIKQWEVAREYRRRLKNRFDELGIEIPFPHRRLYWGAGQAQNIQGT
jgi:small conductance mechanosensitive channel